MNIAEKIKSVRITKGFTQKAIAEKLGVSQQNYAQYENGKRKPKLITIQKIADALEISTIDLFDNFTFLQDLDSSEIRKDVNNWISSIGETKSDTINELFDMLNDTGQDKALEQVELLTKIPEYRKDQNK